MGCYLKDNYGTGICGSHTSGGVIVTQTNMEAPKDKSIMGMSSTC